MGAFRLYYLAGGAAAAITLLAMMLRGRGKSAEDIECARRKHIVEKGRIVDGTVIDAQEIVQKGEPVQLVIFRYDVAGVSYEASQDITHLRQFVDLHSCRIGLPASVRYDPKNPGNSIVVSEQWSGLRL